MSHGGPFAAQVTELPSGENGGFGRVVDEHADVYYFRGINGLPQGTKVGDRGRVVYRITPAYGLWFFEKGEGA